MAILSLKAEMVSDVDALWAKLIRKQASLRARRASLRE